MSTSALSPALDSISRFLVAGESQVLEFKSSFDKTTVESLVAFANAQGGRVLVGVSDAGTVKGVTVGKETLNVWLGQIKASTSPSLIPDLVAQKVDGKTVVVINIAASLKIPIPSFRRRHPGLRSGAESSNINNLDPGFRRGDEMCGIRRCDEFLAAPVGEFPVKPVSTRGRYFKRVASSNQQLSSAEIANLYMQSLQISWDVRSCRAGNDIHCLAH